MRFQWKREKIEARVDTQSLIRLLLAKGGWLQCQCGVTGFQQPRAGHITAY